MTPTPETILDEPVVRSRLARVYAESVMAVAASQNAVDAVGEELDAVVREILTSHPAIDAVLASPVVGKTKKAEALSAALNGRVSPTVANLFGVLNKNGRLGLVRQIAAAYREMRDAKAGRVRVRVTSAVPLLDRQIDALKQTLGARLGKEPMIATVVDPDLLGGLVVKVGDQVFDASVRTRLETLRSQLMDQGTSYVLQNQG